MRSGVVTSRSTPPCWKAHRLCMLRILVSWVTKPDVDPGGPTSAMFPADANDNLLFR